jgi:Dolichyl-phosphate-mannose-protein mannosyltransferase
MHPLAGPLAVPAFLQSMLIAAAILAVAYLYRDIEFAFEIDQTDIAVFVSYVVFFSLLNYRMLSESITCDELYHGERSVFYLYSYPQLPERFKVIPFLRFTPVNELNTYVSAFILLGMGALWFIYRKVVAPLALGWRYGVVFVFMTTLGMAFLCSPLTVEPHPPLRLLPLFISQLILGLSDFSFRFPSLLAASITSFAFYKTLREKFPDALGFCYVIGFSIFMIPTVFHSAAIVEPSIWAFSAAVLVMLAIYSAVKNDDANAMVLASLITGMAVLCRQNTIILWPVLLLITLLNKPFWKKALWIVIPVFFAVPYFMTVAHTGHPVASGSSSGALENLIQAFTTCGGVKGILKSSSVFWTLFLVGGLVYAFFSKEKIRIYFIVLLTGYVLFHILPPGAWGIGRYQAEYVAPAMALTIFLFALEFKAKGRKILIGCLIFLSCFSYYTNTTLSQDVYFSCSDKIRMENLFS